MWMWHKREKRDVFVANVEQFKPGIKTLDGTWVYWYADDGWSLDQLHFFEPPHDHSKTNN